MDDITRNTIRDYEIQEQIGAGGFGAVYRARHLGVEREVAIKFVLPQYANEPDFVRRFESEAKLVAKLEHPHIIPLYDYWRDASGAYIVMRYVREGSLRTQLKAKGMIGLDEMARLLDQIAAALAFAHRNHVIHRDLKPGNILLDEHGHAYLADFGIAKNLATPGLTASQAIVGSPDYLAPEQITHGPVTAQTDIYALGILLYECLCGEHPFPNLTPIQYIYKQVNDSLPFLYELPDAVRDAVNDVIQTATAKDPSLRFGDAEQVASAFRAAIAPRQAATHPATISYHDAPRSIEPSPADTLEPRPASHSIPEIEVKNPYANQPAPPSDRFSGANLGGGNIAVGNITGSNAAIGHNSNVTVNRQEAGSSYQLAFQQIAVQLDLLGSIEPDVLEDARAEIDEIQREAAKDNQADEGILLRKFRALKRIEPRIYEVVLGILMHPTSGVADAVKSAAKSARNS